MATSWTRSDAPGGSYPSTRGPTRTLLKVCEMSGPEGMIDAPRCAMALRSPAPLLVWPGIPRRAKSAQCEITLYPTTNTWHVQIVQTEVRQRRFPSSHPSRDKVDERICPIRTDQIRSPTMTTKVLIEVECQVPCCKPHAGPRRKPWYATWVVCCDP